MATVGRADCGAGGVRELLERFCLWFLLHYGTVIAYDKDKAEFIEYSKLKIRNS